MHAKTLGAVLLSDILGTKNVAINLLLCQVLMQNVCQYQTRCVSCDYMHVFLQPVAVYHSLELYGYIFCTLIIANNFMGALLACIKLCCPALLGGNARLDCYFHAKQALGALQLASSFPAYSVFRVSKAHISRELYFPSRNLQRATLCHKT